MSLKFRNGLLNQGENIMFKLKRTFIATLFALTLASLAFAQVSIGGISIQNAESKKEEIETKYGKFTVKTGFPVERYESGAVKSFYIDDFEEPLKFAELNHPDYGKIIVSTPTPKDYFTTEKPQPLEFYENGNIKTLKLASIKYSENPGGYFNIKFEKYDESLAIFPNSTIHFYENGKVESINVASEQSFKFLRDASIDTKTKAVFENQSEIEFYDDGNIKKYTSQNAKIKNPLNLKMRKGKSVVVSKDNPILAIGFYPETGSSIALSDTIVVKCVPGEPIYFWENGTSLKQISWSFNTVNFSIGKVNFYSGLNGESVQQTVYFDKTGYVKTVKGITSTSFSVTSFDGEKSILSYPTLVEGKATNVQQIDYDNNGNMILADLGRNPLELSSEEVKNGIQTIRAWKIYYQEGKKVAVVGNAYLQSSKGSFYNTNYSCIILFDGDKVLRIIKPDEDVRISADSNIIFDSNGKAVSFTATDYNRKTVEIEIK